MKKITALLLVLSLVFCFAGCQKGDTNTDSSYGIDINYYVGVGQINEAKYGLGLDPDEIEKDAEKQDINHDHTGGDGHEGVITYEDYQGKEAYIVDGFYYCFLTGEEEKGISCIIGTDTIYGFSTGTATKFEISEAVSAMNPESSLASSDEFFYMPFAMEDVDTLTCKNGDNVLKFYFEDDILVAACVFSSEKWEF